MAKKKSHYAVARGRNPGIYSTWDGCKAQVNGYPGAIYKGFKSQSEAQEFLNQNSCVATALTIGKSSSTDDTGHLHWNSLSASNSKSNSHASSSMNHHSDRKRGNSITNDIVDLCGSDNDGVANSINPLSAKRARCKEDSHPNNPTVEKLNGLQRQAFESAKRGKNIFITGPAGTGKSVVLKHILIHLKTKYQDQPHKYVAVAPTGPTAISIKGQTIHSFAGCGVPETDGDFGKCWKQKKRWRGLEVMIVEELSMISGEFMDRLSKVVSGIRDSSAPFGGIQLVLCGDFLQLPPIPKSASKIEATKYALERQNRQFSVSSLHQDRGFAFQSRAWRNANLEIIQLDQVFRQSKMDFISVLRDIRLGRVSSDSQRFLEACNRPLPPNKDGIEPTVLYATNRDVSRENMMHLNKLPGEVQTFHATDFAEPEPEASGFWAMDMLLKNSFYKQCLAEKALSLKVGAQVMLIKNEEGSANNRLVNGSRGKVIGFTDDDSDDDNNGGDHSDIRGNKFDLEGQSAVDDVGRGSGPYPVVQFRGGRRKVIRPVRFESCIFGLGVCVREAIPLKLAWAVTMHKSQGLTLDYVKADVGGVFTEAQAYVALSRATDETGLELRNFSPKVVRADKRALSFYANPHGVFITWDEEEKENANNSSSLISSSNETVACASNPPPSKQGCLAGLAFVLTGELEGFSRDRAERLIEECGGFVRSAVSGKTNYLVIGTALEDGRPVTSSTKYKKATEIINGSNNKAGLKVLTKDVLFSLIRERSR